MNVDILIIMRYFQLDEYTSKNEQDGNSLLHIAVQLEKINVVEYILMNNATLKEPSLIPIKNKNGENPVVTAAYSESRDALMLLLKYLQSYLQENDFEEVKRRIALAYPVLKSLELLWKHAECSITWKLRT